MGMPERYVGLDFIIDTNRINAKEKLPNMNTLEKWARDGVISLDIAAVAQDETKQGTDSSRRNKAFSYVSLLLKPGSEPGRRKEIEKILDPKSRNDQRDIDIVLTADHHKKILITADGGSKNQPEGILGHKNQLAALIPPIQVISDHEAVKLVNDKIKSRDQSARWNAERTSIECPDWVGRDDK